MPSGQKTENTNPYSVGPQHQQAIPFRLEYDAVRVLLISYASPLGSSANLGPH